MLRRKNPATTVMGLAIELNSTNAKKLAADLAQLQLGVFMAMPAVHFLDQAAGPGHARYELSKFGIAVQHAIKDDLRNHADDKSLIAFYVDVLAACIKSNNYELGARVCAGINDATMLDEGIEFEHEDAGTKLKRQQLKSTLESIKKWMGLRETDFPRDDHSKTLYRKHLHKRQTFIPSITAFTFFMTGWLNAAADCYLEDNALPAEKMARLLEITNDAKAELKFIQDILEHLKNKSGKAKLHFNQLREIFSASLSLNPLGENDQDKVLNSVLKVNAMKNKMPRAETTSILIPKLHISPRGQVKQRTPRQTVDSESFVGSPRSEGALSPKSEAVVSARSEGRYSPRLYLSHEDSSHAHEWVGSSHSEEMFTPPVSPGRVELESPRSRLQEGRN